MSRRDLRGARAIVTGASGGIGREVAYELARRGSKLLITARREECLAETEQVIAPLGNEVFAVVGDITLPEVRTQICRAAQDRWGAIDILVNNAGVGAHGRFEDAQPDRMRAIMEVNFFAPVELIRLALPLLRRGNQPLIANVSSVLGHRAVPDKSEYCASKFALHGFSDSLRAELSSSRIGVLLISPSTTETDFGDHLLENLGGKKIHGPPMSAATAARQAVRAMQRGRDEVILSASGKLLVWLDRLSPPLANWLIAKYG